MKITVNGTLHEDPFGLSWLRHSQTVNHTYDLGDPQAGRQVALLGGNVSLGGSIEEQGGELDLDLKVAVLGMPLLDKRVPIAKHLTDGPISVTCGGPQLGFSGTVLVVE